MKRGVGLMFPRQRVERVLLLACEWTPATEATAREFQRMGRDVHVITTRRDGQPETEVHRGLHLHVIEVPEEDRTTALGRAVLNIWLAAMGSRVLTTYGRFDLLAACDESVADGIALLAEKARLPLCAPVAACGQGSWSPMEGNG